MALEWKKLSDRGCWDLKGVKPKREVADRAKKDKDLKVHFGRIFGICVEKGSELPEGDKGRKFKGRYVFQGNEVRDEFHEYAIFNDLGSSPVTMEGSKMVDCFGRLPGHTIEQSDARQAYTQAEMGSTTPDEDYGPVVTETWVTLPEEFWPASWKDIVNPVCPLRYALYGHPDAGGYWEAHCEKHLGEVGV